MPPKVKKSSPSGGAAAQKPQTPPPDPSPTPAVGSEPDVSTPANGAGDTAAASEKPIRQKKDRPVEDTREVVHPVPDTKLCLGPDALTIEQAKDLIGWEEVPQADKACCAELAMFLPKRFIRLKRNPSNRWLTPGWLLELKQEFLNRRWRFNGESVVVGRYGNILSGQHRLLAFILAELERQGVGKDAPKTVGHWKDVWGDTPLTLETVVTVGVDETDDVFKTLNCGKKGTLAEVLYRSTYFQACGSEDRKRRAQLADWAIRILWDRTWLTKDPYAPSRTHGEAMDFLAHHQHIIQAVEFIDKEYGDDQVIRKILSPGNAAGVLYLMAASDTDGQRYWNADPRMEGDGESALINFDKWDQACDFWIALHRTDGTASKMMEPVRVAMGRLASTDEMGRVVRSGTLKEKLVVLANAWNYWAEGDDFDAEDLRPLWTEEDPKTGRQKLKNVPTFGGIDRGIPLDEEETERETVTPAEAESPERAANLAAAAEEVERRNRVAAEIMARREARKAAAQAKAAELKSDKEATAAQESGESQTATT